MTLLEPDRDQLERFVGNLFRYAGTEGYVSVRAFPDNGKAEKAFRIQGVPLTAGLNYLVEVAEDIARRAANEPERIVFAPPLGIFNNKDKAREEDLLAGLVLSVECDEHPRQALATLSAIIGPPTVVVRSGGQWADLATGEAHDKRHLHWRLAQPARGDDLPRLKQARAMATRIVGGDASNIPACHPIRWPGSWHRKAEPVLCEIEDIDPDCEISLSVAFDLLKAVAPLPAQGNGADPREAGGIPQANPDVIAAALAIIPNNVGWVEWNNIGMATWRATDGSDAGFAAFDAWSQKSEKYDETYTSKKWAGYFKSPPTSIGAGTILYLAEQYSPGWRPISYPEMRPGPDPFPDGLRVEDPPAGQVVEAPAAPPAEPEQEAREPDQEAPAPEPEPPPADAPKGDDQDDLLRNLNDKYMVVPDGGKSRVLTFDRFVRTVGSRTYVRQVPTFYAFSDFRNLLMHRKARVWNPNTEKFSYPPLGKWWLDQRGRRQYEGVVFDPCGPAVVDGRLNLWRGWGVEPKPGDWSLMREHIRVVLANGDQAADEYNKKWMAWSVQHPAERAETVIVHKGKRGTGKGTVGNALMVLFGQHGVHISSTDHVAGRFNAHLRDCCFLFADEAYWPGNKAAEGTLQRVITEPELFIEAKGRDGVTVPNLLHIMMASNEDWVVPAGEYERRYAVFEVSERYRQDKKWFGPLYRQLENGGYAAMLLDLLNYDLGDWHPRELLRTPALLDQQKLSLNPFDSWWVQLLETGELEGADPNAPYCAVSNAYTEDVSYDGHIRTVKHDGLYDQARAIEPRLKGRSDHVLGQFLKKQGCTNTERGRGARLDVSDVGRVPQGLAETLA